MNCWQSPAAASFNGTSSASPVSMALYLPAGGVCVMRISVLLGMAFHFSSKGFPRGLPKMFKSKSVAPESSNKVQLVSSCRGLITPACLSASRKTHCTASHLKTSKFLAPESQKIYLHNDTLGAQSWWNNTKKSTPLFLHFEESDMKTTVKLQISITKKLVESPNFLRMTARREIAGHDQYVAVGNVARIQRASVRVRHTNEPGHGHESNYFFASPVTKQLETSIFNFEIYQSKLGFEKRSLAGDECPVDFGALLSDNETNVKFGRNMLKYFEMEDGYVNINHGSYGATPRLVTECFNYWHRRAESNPD
uniref:Uncharacterized protein n=1 Tax=Romanomermis culicivorax TaxID=13658 RepID=A0A915IDY6_ROMCU